MQANSGRLDILILIRITNIYAEPEYHFLQNPRKAIQLEHDYAIPAALSLGPGPSSNQNQRASDPPARRRELPASNKPTVLPAGVTAIDPANSEISDLPRKLSEMTSTSKENHGPINQGPLSQYKSSKHKFTSKLRADNDLTSFHPTGPPRNASCQTHATQRYPYTELLDGQIRLFTLFPGEANDELRGVIWTTASDYAGHYATLSYVWGSSKQFPHQLKTACGPLGITDSLRAALVRLRRKDESLTLWVDAICIDQANDTEKSKQIILLPEIFQMSAYTFAYIDGDHDHSKAIQMIKQVQALRLFGPESEAWPADLPRCPSSWVDKKIPPPSDSVWEEFRAFFHHAWFRRAWIVQEAVIARNLQVVHREYLIKWEFLYDAMTYITGRLETNIATTSKSWAPFMQLGRLREIEGNAGRLSILKLLENFRYVQSSDPRDKYFSLLGISTDGDLDGFEPDYDPDVSFGDITKRICVVLFRRFAARKQAMLLLYPAGLDSHSNDLPSWMPDWTVEKPNGLHQSSERGTEFNASSGTEEQMEYDEETGHLLVETYAIAPVKLVSQSSLEPGLSARLAFFTEAESMLSKAFGDAWDETQLQKALCEVPVAGARHPKYATPSDLSILDSWKAFKELLDLEKGSAHRTNAAKCGLDDVPLANDFRAATMAKLKEQSRVYESLLDEEVCGWRFVILKGYADEGDFCGIAPNSVREGDMVRIFQGGRVPFVTRKSQDVPGAERLIGQCYVQDMMEGEALQYEELEPETVTLH